ncbi:MAG: hypothetical protein GF344_03290 [Chitinivibrionales bacterium]|nr:hypothetical protein [Chitinivibrionales bacterium]MBD3356100.1 hypothetical protein [Chitinivibrionales bacterium]
MSHLFTISAVLICTTAIGSAQIQTVVNDNRGEGKVDWSQRKIIGIGVATPNPNLPESVAQPSATREAIRLARRNALETVKGIHLNSSATVRDFITTSDAVTNRIINFVNGFEQNKQIKTVEDGALQTIIEIPLDGAEGLGGTLLSNRLADKPAPKSFEGKKAKTAQSFTGLIIDCGGIDLKPALSPSVLDEAGKEVYGATFASREWALKHGLVRYAGRASESAYRSRVGDNPAKVKAIKAVGDARTDPIISNKDAATIRSTPANLNFLSECRIVILID